MGKYEQVYLRGTLPSIRVQVLLTDILASLIIQAFIILFYIYDQNSSDLRKGLLLFG